MCGPFLVVVDNESKRANQTGGAFYDQQRVYGSPGRSKPSHTNTETVERLALRSCHGLMGTRHFFHSFWLFLFNVMVVILPYPLRGLEFAEGSGYPVEHLHFRIVLLWVAVMNKVVATVHPRSWDVERTVVHCREDSIVDAHQAAEDPRHRKEQLSEEEHTEHFHKKELNKRIAPCRCRTKVLGRTMMSLVKVLVQSRVMKSIVNEHSNSTINYIIKDGQAREIRNTIKVVPPGPVS